MLNSLILRGNFARTRSPARTQSRARFASAGADASAGVANATRTTKGNFASEIRWPN